MVVRFIAQCLCSTEVEHQELLVNLEANLML
jgi:hypothetical protein